jgi:hypothetical protein
MGTSIVRAAEATEPAAGVIAQASAAPSPAAAPSPTASPSPPPYQYSATAEGSYMYAPTYLGTGVRTILGRAFDNRANEPTFNTLNLQGSKSSAGVIGWKMELNIGNDANGLASWNSWQLTPSPSQVTGSSAAAGCGTGPGSSTAVGPSLGPAIPFPPFDNPYKCVGGAYLHTGGYDMTQFYVQYATPNGAWTLTAGRMFTLVGYEVAESWNNAQFGRGLLWTYAEPITHTGVRLAYGGIKDLTITLGGNNGWDDIVGTAGAMRSLESQVAYTNGGLSASAAFLYGPEQASYYSDGGQGIGYQCSVTATGALVSPNTCGLTAVGATAAFPTVGPIGQRSLLDLVASYKITPAVIVAANYDMGAQTNTAPFVTSTTGVIWDGVAGYLGYTSPAGKWGLSGRYEVFNDPQGYRFGISTLASAFGLNLRMHEATVTGIYNLGSNVNLRAEWRMDYFTYPGSSVVQVVPRPNGTAGLVQGTAGLDLVAHY